ncbi:hypothetical protein KP509_12G027300 [Ceratopteris richardii]|nr:hypothetical protein KP509_12G027300 [Ceratopteris richardii]
MDADHDGRLSGKDLSAWMHKLGLSASEKSARRLMALRDAGNSGSLDFEGFIGLNRDTEPTEVVGAQDEGGSRQKLLMEAFDIFDKDHDGLISPKELSGTLQDLGLMDKNIEESEYMNMIKRADFDGDGQLSFADFQSMMDHKDVKLATCR